VVEEVRVAYVFTVRDRGGALLSAERLHAVGDRLMTALLALEELHPRLTDSATSTDASRGTVRAEMTITAAEDEPSWLAFSAEIVGAAEKAACDVVLHHDADADPQRPGG